LLKISWFAPIKNDLFVQRRLLSRCIDVDVKMLVHDKQDFCIDWANLKNSLLNMSLDKNCPFCSKIGQGLK